MNLHTILEAYGISITAPHRRLLLELINYLPYPCCFVKQTVLVLSAVFLNASMLMRFPPIEVLPVLQQIKLFFHTFSYTYIYTYIYFHAMFCRTILTLAAFLLHVRKSPFKIWCFNNNSCFDSYGNHLILRRSVKFHQCSSYLVLQKVACLTGMLILSKKSTRDFSRV